MTESREPESPQPQGVPTGPEAATPEQAPAVPPAPPVIPAAPPVFPAAPSIPAPPVPAAGPAAPEPSAATAPPVAPQAEAPGEPAPDVVVPVPQEVVVPPEAEAPSPDPVAEPVVVEPAVAQPVVAAEPATDAEPEIVASSVGDVSQGVVEPEVAAEPEPPVVEPEAVAEPEVPVAPEPVAEPSSAVPVSPGLPTVPAWSPPPAEPEPAPGVEDVGAPAVAEATDTSEPEGVAAPSLLLPPPPPAEPFQPAVEESVPAPVWNEPEAADQAVPVVPAWGGTPSPLSEASEDNDAVSEEQRKLAAERAARRDARSAALASPDPVVGVEAFPTGSDSTDEPAATKRTTDGFWASLGLFLLRLALAAVFGIRGFQMLMDPTATQKLLSQTLLPMPGLLGPITAIASLLIAVAMVVGLATRYAAIGGAVIAVGSLVWVYWGAFAVFIPVQGFLGESSVTTAAACLLLVFLGGGGWSLDRSLRAARQKDKAMKAARGSARSIELD